ncbi:MULTISPECIES: helix-turn-helix domain-containing protein [unclassified Streptomyces]|uniref:helix-turn-helix domain-containing protein n=1 Tax=unclassified Streptomyces TaxID=2593676 RepID=UPI0011CBC020|nr:MULTISPECIES: helix-turn-helix transcriptional regulator [unclassified Streptomyces]TXS12599.1 XRE family transcriptional regulator [Streptomyces sp. wa22]WSQ75598.1 helix-turn-helix transcriptional regulator [Streptomyces sp. NBC_01213]WSR04523.1 helix-turn-helix transcriptional regulator [Streptomyces sp. NBC_01208]WSR52827.1 helix-turn-helix transcriptional regulator [Streptomyces sp. NBC_01201]
MSQENRVEALLEEARLNASMPSPAERQRLREAASLSRAQVAAAVGVGRTTVANWETGHSDPTPPGRLPYLKLLKGLAEIYPATSAPAATLEPTADSAPFPPAFAAAPETLRGLDGRAIEGDPGPCIRCGIETAYQSTDGRPLHSGGLCQPAAPQAAAAAASPTAAAAPAAAPAAPASPAPAPVPSRPERRARSAARAQADTTALIARAVQEEAERAGGDEEAALKALIKRAIPDVMHLFNETRATARYDYTAYPALPDILKKPSKKDPDQIWEARPKFHHPGYSLRAPGDVKVTALDVNAAYLSALKCWLPIGKLEHSTGSDGVDPKRSGVHLITPAEWAHPHLPDPIGDRDEPGALWVTNSTLRLLQRLSGPKYGLTDAPVIHESWTSGATENFLDALRKLLSAARDEAIENRDTLTLEYVKAMYSKFISTMGESIHNREMVRPDWMHIIHSQAYANLWGKAYKAHQAGLAVVAMMGTDELHLTGDWRAVFPEGRGVAQMKVKHGDAKASGEYTVGTVAR